MGKFKMNFDNAGGGKYLKEGLHDVKIVKIEEGESKVKKTPLLKITFKNVKGELSDDFYLSEGAMERLTKLFMACNDGDETMKGEKELTLAQIKSGLKDKMVQIRVVGEYGSKFENGDYVEDTSKVYSKLDPWHFEPAEEVPF